MRFLILGGTMFLGRRSFLEAHGVKPWTGPRSIPLWVPLPENAGFGRRDATPSHAAGLTVRGDGAPPGLARDD